ncbi:hypothetical protein QSH46_021775 [Xanthomonas arboricola pv. juglandis]|uniref:hypothetical protein n=1 Tax=Xanthomonas arboricola TaxID=56448 RepID=UPI000B0ECDDF|nr:hypothetical protein [Xanthomonas arboricola]MDN0222724.1 hypothetical protein [Xanthomonas arboricola pv. juglandis]MDN0226967.1 hypothetical protein [Xanthomonas arboricola pv. juglandis]MDN0231240.1 hypothetical protein [Xanthomonas arboricola pv. juglandis]MDN0235489.1 hypothetical protein [Xanthomonas arboricola pv. juglandis]MDN0239736.1 hypothetical protein [Xanthomonas arboricola pv. juglandis]
MSDKPIPRWSRDTQIFIREAGYSHGRGPGYIEVKATCQGFHCVELCPPDYVGMAVECVLEKLSREIGRRAVFA